MASDEEEEDWSVAAGRAVAQEQREQQELQKQQKVQQQQQAKANHTNGEDDEDDDEDDEYKDVDSSGHTFIAPEVVLESGRVLREVQVRYRTFGRLNASRSNCIVACHALTGNASLDAWWGSMLGQGRLFDDTQMYIVCANILGSCYGTCGPTSADPATGRPYGRDFPDVTVRDSVGLHLQLVKEHLRVRRVACVIGGSLGGMQTLEWACLGGPDFVGAIIPMCCGAFHHPWQIGISETQRLAIYADPDWNDGDYLATGGPRPSRGLSVARAMAMISYRSHAGYGRKFARKLAKPKNGAAGAGQAADGQAAGPAAPAAPVAGPAAPADQRAPAEATAAAASEDSRRLFEVEGYLRHQGAKFCQRFDALSYVKVTRMMDSHDVGRGRPGGAEGVLARLAQPVLVVSVQSDNLYPPAEQTFLHEHLPNATLFLVESDHGHDGFLLDQEAIMPAALEFLNEHVYAALEQQPQQQLDQQERVAKL